MTVSDDLALVRSALRLDERVKGGNEGPLAALARVETELARLMERPGVEVGPDGNEIDWKGDAKYAVKQIQAWREHAESVEAELVRLRDGLREIAEREPCGDYYCGFCGCVDKIQGQARALLAVRPDDGNTA